MSRQNLSRADSLFAGRAQFNRAFNAKGGVPVALVSRYRAAPALAVANGASVSASVSLGVAAVLGGSLASGGVVTFDVPRNAVGAWTGTAIVTITGTDQYGAPLIERSASGTTHTGKKAFKTITSIVPNANITAATFGSGSVLGLPNRVDASDLLAARFNNAIDAGTFVPADTTSPATATTGDVYGTFAPAGTLDGAKVLSLLFAIADMTSKIGSYGVDQYTG